MYGAQWGVDKVEFLQELLDIMKRPAASAAGTFTRDHVKAILMVTLFFFEKDSHGNWSN